MRSEPMRRERFKLWVILGLIGCTAKAPMEHDPKPVAAPPAVEASPPGEVSPAIEVSIAEARSTGESIPAARVTLRFRNRGTGAVIVRGYRVEWPGGRFEADPIELRVEAGAEAERTARIQQG